MLVSILQVLLDAVNSDGEVKSLVRELLESLARVPRFSTVLLFFNKQDRELAGRVCHMAGDNILGWKL